MTVIANAVIAARGVGDKGHGVIVAAVAVVDGAGRRERLARADVLAVEGLDEGRRVAGDQVAADQADLLVPDVGHVEIACAVHRHTTGSTESCRTAVAVTGTYFAGGASQGRNYAGGGDLADLIIDGIAYVDAARVVHRHTVGSIKSCRAAGTVAGTCFAGGASQGCDYPGGGDLADLIIVAVGHVDVARTVHRHTVGSIKSCRAADAIAGTCLPGGASQGGNYARRSDLADLRIVLIGNIEVARAVHGHTRGIVESCRAAGAIAGTRLPSGAGKGGDDARWSDLADLIIVGVGHVNVARAIHRHTVGIMESCRAAGAIAGTCLPRGASQGGNYAKRSDLADLIIVAVGHVDVARAVHRGTPGKPKSCRAAGAIAGTCLPSRAGHGGDGNRDRRRGRRGGGTIVNLRAGSRGDRDRPGGNRLRGRTRAAREARTGA